MAIKTRLLVFIGIAIVILGLSCGVLYWAYQNKPLPNVPTGPVTPSTGVKNEDFKVRKFSSATEFKEFFQQNQVNQRAVPATGAVTMEKSVSMMAPAADVGGGFSPERVSETNVQVRGIDEPDIVKTDGTSLYFSPQNRFFVRPLVREKMIAPDFPQQGEIRAFNAFPPSSLKELSQINKNGEMLLFDKTLIIFGTDNKIYGFDVTDPAKPVQKWLQNFGDQSSLVGARKVAGELIMVVKTYSASPGTCLIRPMGSLEIACIDIYHPILPVMADSVFTVVKISPHDGRIKDKSSIVGSSAQSVLYVSNSNIYITYQREIDPVVLVVGFVRENTDVLSAEVTNRIIKLSGLDISPTAKATELGVILGKYFGSLSNDESLRLQNELNNRLGSYFQKKIYEFEGTGIVKIELGGFDKIASGVVPGTPLNQFSLDEYKGNLRIAVTVGQNQFWGIPYFSGRVESRNGVFVLDSSLSKIGSVTELGLGERVYSARFMGDQGYLVTFRQTDPFYVLDLKDPAAPKMAGELKIPGYSAYLEEIKLNTVLGVGMEGSEVKLSLFDVSDPKNPVELDKYLLNEYWTEVNTNHHAFLLDRANSVFFLPGGKGGYIFSYTGNRLKLVKAVSETNLRRAIYINNYFYLISDNAIVVLSVNDWQTVAKLDF